MIYRLLVNFWILSRFSSDHFNVKAVVWLRHFNWSFWCSLSLKLILELWSRGASFKRFSFWSLLLDLLYFWFFLSKLLLLSLIKLILYVVFRCTSKSHVCLLLHFFDFSMGQWCPHHGLILLFRFVVDILLHKIIPGVVSNIVRDVVLIIRLLSIFVLSDWLGSDNSRGLVHRGHTFDFLNRRGVNSFQVFTRKLISSTLSHFRIRILNIWLSHSLSIPGIIWINFQRCFPLSKWLYIVGRFAWGPNRGFVFSLEFRGAHKSAIWFLPYRCSWLPVRRGHHLVVPLVLRFLLPRIVVLRIWTVFIGSTFCSILRRTWFNSHL